MLIALLAAIAFFIVSNAIVEYANRATMNWMQQPYKWRRLSLYLYHCLKMTVEWEDI